MAINKTYFTKNLMLHGEIRKCEKVDKSFDTNDKDGQAKHIEKFILEILIDDDDLERMKIIDENLGNEALYQRGTEGTFRLRLDMEESFREKIKITTIEFIPDKKGK